MRFGPKGRGEVSPGDALGGRRSSGFCGRAAIGSGGGFRSQIDL
jgi:hypothetical protein